VIEGFGQCRRDARSDWEYKEIHMKLSVKMLGSITRATRDFSGDFWWDNLLFDFYKRRPPG
jgi:hypothetical protein